MAAAPEERLSWEQVLENEWLRKMTQEVDFGRSLVDVDLNESSNYIEA